MARGIQHFGSFGADTAAGDILATDALQAVPISLTGSADSLNIHSPIGQNYIINSTVVDAIVLPAPVSGVDDNLSIAIWSATAHAHTVTSTGNLSTGTASVNKATFAAQLGAGVFLRAYGGKWQVIGATGITFS
jgi:hypothetical protein